VAARFFLNPLKPIAPLLVMPGNHDVQWWASPFGIFGQRAKYAKYRRYFGEALTPTLQIPGVTIASMLSSYGIAFGSLTWNPNDMGTIGHLPASEVQRVRKIYESAPAGSARIAVVHHNVIRGNISKRMGLVRWRTAQRRLVELGVEAVLCGHDHEEVAAEIDGAVVVSGTGTPTDRTRGKRPSAFNVLRLDSDRIQVEHHLWDGEAKRFRRGDVAAFARKHAAGTLAGA
jgi:3',5'-cyclic AMP phosphodiesterase CpdA